MCNIQPFIQSSDIKLIVFDLHGSITNRTSIHPYHISYRNKYIEKETGATEPITIQLTTDEAFEQFPMLDKYAYYKKRDHDPAFKFESIHTPNPLLRAKLQALSSSFIFVLYTDSYHKQIDRTLEAVNLLGIFDEIIGVEENQRKLAPTTIIYPELCRRYHIHMHHILMIGDRMDKDINPILKAGGNALQVKSDEFMLEALDFIGNKFFKKETNIHI